MRTPKHLSRFITGMSLLSCLLCFDCALGLSSLAQSRDDEAILSLVGRLFESYQQEDLDKLTSLWSEKSSFLSENKKALREEFTAYEKIAVKSFDIRRMKIDGDKATLRVVSEMALTRANMVKAIEKIEKKTRTIELVNESGTWKVWKFIAGEEELAAAIIAAKTDEERKALLEREPELITSDLADYLIRRNYPIIGDNKNYQNALAINQLARKLGEQTGEPWVIANALMNAGYIHGWIGTPEKSHEMALQYFLKSLKIGEEFGYKELTASSLVRAAVIYHLLSEYSQATEYYHRGLKLAEELGDLKLMGQAMNNLSIIYRENGNYAKGLWFLLKCLQLLENQLNSDPNWELLSRVLTNIGRIFASQGNVEQALAYYQRGLEMAEKGIKSGDTRARFSKEPVLSLIGQVYLEQGNLSLAKEYFQKSQRLLEEGVDPLIPTDIAVFWAKESIGEVLAAENNILQAIATYQEALQLAEKYRYKEGMSSASLSLGKLHLSRGDYHEALTYAERVVEAAEETTQSVYRALEIAAKAYLKLNRLEEAHQTLVRAIDITEQLREHLAGGELDRQRSFEGAVSPYQTMIDLQIDQKQFTEAFSYAQRAKGRTLLELLQNGRVNIDKSASAAEREQEQQLSRKITSLNSQITSEKLKSQPDEKLLGSFEEELKKSRLEFDAFQTALYAAHPELKVQRGEIRPVSISDAGDLIPNSKTALLDFIVTNENVHLFVVTKDSSAQPILNTYTVKIERKLLTEKSERFRRRMENRDYDFQELSKELYNLLLKPAQKQLQNKTNLIISPDNVLWNLPFQVLLSPNLRYLVEDAAISYVPSLSVLREMQLGRKKNQTPAKALLLALGNPDLGKQSIETAKFVKMDAELQPLPEAATQVRSLGRLYGKTLSNVYTGTDAREELVKEQSARYRILHLAAHGIFNDISPMYSHILLSQTPGKDGEDGLLEAWEMMNLDLNADLVVLSACETARGRVGAGEGVIGMTWALFVAGCPRTVVSQWKVEASSTTALMLEFHKRFKTRLEHQKSAVSTAEAMRQAALKVMKNPEYVHPFYWGGFVVVGDGN